MSYVCKGNVADAQATATSGEKRNKKGSKGLGLSPRRNAGIRLDSKRPQLQGCSHWNSVEKSESDLFLNSEWPLCVGQKATWDWLLHEDIWLADGMDLLKCWLSTPFCYISTTNDLQKAPPKMFPTVCQDNAIKKSCDYCRLSIHRVFTTIWKWFPFLIFILSLELDLVYFKQSK